MLNVSNQAFEQKRWLEIQLFKKVQNSFSDSSNTYIKQMVDTHFDISKKKTPKTLIKSIDIVYFLHKRFVLWQNDDLYIFFVKECLFQNKNT